MNHPLTRKHGLFVVVIAAWIGVIALYPFASAWAHQPAADPAHAAHAGASADAAAMAKQITELRDKVTRLESALQKGQLAGSGAGMQGMGSMSGQTGGSMKGMGKMDMDSMGEMKGMNSGSGGQMGMVKMDMMGGMGGMGDAGSMSMMDMDMMGMMGMMGRGKMGGKSMQGKMAMTSSLPGFPGASHLYHIGSTGFFLDHPEHITLTTEQQSALNQIKERALLAKASLDRQVDEAEQELWVLTGSDQPDAAKIEAKIRQVEKLNGDQRLAFIRSVGEAANVLTESQRKVLVGLQQPASAAAPAADPAKAPHVHTP